jgi:hypothetical protein
LENKIMERVATSHHKRLYIIPIEHLKALKLNSLHEDNTNKTSKSSLIQKVVLENM